MNSWGYKPLFCSASRNSGLDSLVDILANKTSVIIGPSGVGKSSVINALGDVAGLNPWTKCADGEDSSFDIEVVSHQTSASFHSS
jgi:predicted GTPase